MLRYESVEAFISDLDEKRKREVTLLREIIAECHADLTEIIKWNAPSYQLGGEDRITFNVNNKEQIVKLVLHMGATRREDKKANPIMVDETGLVVWNSNIRGTMSFSDYDDIVLKRAEIMSIIRRWLDTK